MRQMIAIKKNKRLFKNTLLLLILSFHNFFSLEFSKIGSEELKFYAISLGILRLITVI
jgi:hypothetical protein